MFLLAFFLLEAATGVFLYVNRGQVESITRKSLNTVFEDYSNKSESRAFVDEIQHDVSIYYIYLYICFLFFSIIVNIITAPQVSEILRRRGFQIEHKMSIM